MSVESKKKEKILIAEDDNTSAELLKTMLEKAGYFCVTTNNGKNAYRELQKNNYHALLTDWMMPQMDGIELIRKTRENIINPPVIVVITSLSSQEARDHALSSGADDFLAKPYSPNDILRKLEEIFLRIEQKLPDAKPLSIIKTDIRPPFAGICIAASSGGPQTLYKILCSMKTLGNSAIFIVQHGPSWALKDMACHWSKQCKMEVSLGSDGEKIIPGKIYLAPGNFHMTVGLGPFHIKLNDDPPENFVKPAADPLFKSIAKSFGKYSMSIVLSGMGCDGAIGSQYIAAARGIVIAEDPETALVRFMPQAVMQTVPGAICLSLSDITTAINKHSLEFSKFLNN